MRRALSFVVTAIILGSVSIGIMQLFPPPKNAVAQETTFFRIGTGGLLGTYYRVGGVIAETISNPPGSYPCDRGGVCGVPGLIAIAQTSGGSIANINAIVEGSLESGFAQADTSYAAFGGKGSFADNAPADQLRVIAPLFEEQLQLVAHPASGIESAADLIGKRVSLDTEDSGTIVVARQVLDAFDITEADIEPVHVKPAQAIDLMASGELDAFFIMAGAPTPSVIEAKNRVDARLIPMAGVEIDTLLAGNPSYQATIIDDYGEDGSVATIGVSALWLVDSRVSDDLIYQITEALYRPEADRVMSALPDDLRIKTDQMPQDLPIPLHAGSRRFFEETWGLAHTD